MILGVLGTGIFNCIEFEGIKIFATEITWQNTKNCYNKIILGLPIWQSSDLIEVGVLMFMYQSVKIGTINC